MWAQSPSYVNLSNAAARRHNRKCVVEQLHLKTMASTATIGTRTCRNRRALSYESTEIRTAHLMSTELCTLPIGREIFSRSRCGPLIHPVHSAHSHVLVALLCRISFRFFCSSMRSTEFYNTSISIPCIRARIIHTHCCSLIFCADAEKSSLILRLVFRPQSIYKEPP